MTENNSRHLLDRLAEIKDPRNEKGKRHPLNSILGLNIIGFMCGHKGYTSTAKWARSQTSPKHSVLHTRNLLAPQRCIMF